MPISVFFYVSEKLSYFREAAEGRPLIILKGYIHLMSLPLGSTTVNSAIAPR